MTNVPIKCDVLQDLVPFVQFKKREKHPWRSVTFSKVAGNFTKTSCPLWMFFTFFNLYKWYQIAQSVSCRNQLIEKLANHNWS